MKIAVLSDLHCNVFALKAVLADVAAGQPDHVILLGDTFGYYPWAVETWSLVRELNATSILGNHDQLVLDATPPVPAPMYWELAKKNHQELAASAPEAILWLRGLSPRVDFVLDERRIVCCHGTPEDPLNGRYYPDNPDDPAKSPECACLLLGHTHYPLVRTTAAGALVINPGSVGQPRDGDPRASWGWLYPRRMRFEPRRTGYDVQAAVMLLAERGWNKHAQDALCKNYPGRLKVT